MALCWPEHFGGSLLGDVLTAFTEFTPRRDHPKIGGGARERPRVVPFSPPKPLNQTAQQFRRFSQPYLSRSSHDTRRPACPSSPSQLGASIDGSSRKALPWLIQRGVEHVPSGERSPSKQAAVRRSHNLSKSPISLSPKKMGIPVLGHSSHIGLNEFDNKRMESELQQHANNTSRKDSDSCDAVPEKLLAKTLFKQRTCDDLRVEDQKTIGIWKLHLDSPREDRMARLTKNRKTKEVENSLSGRDKVSSREEIELAEESYFRYFKQSKRLERSSTLMSLKEQNSLQERILDALRDFGIRPRSQPEKSGLFKALEEFLEKGEFTFKDFCNLIEETRSKTRACRFSSVFAVWRQLDAEDAGGLDADEAMQLLKMLNIDPTNPIDIAEVEARIDRLRKDSNGLYSFGEIEYLAQECREYVESSRSRVEHQLQQSHDLKIRDFRELRTHIIELHEQFRRLDTDNMGTLSLDEVMYMLADFGVITQCTSAEKKGIRKDLVGLLERLGNKDVEHIKFSEYLSSVGLLRKRLSDQFFDMVASLFRIYDRDNSKALEMKEVCAVIQDMELLPRTLAEQDAIAELLEESDVDGSGSLQFDEVLLMIVRIVERTNFLQRSLENASAEFLNFSPHQTFELRQAFETLDFDNSGALTFSEVCKAAQKMQWRDFAKITQRSLDAKISQLFKEFDIDDSGCINFVEFLNLMCKIDQEMNEALDDRPANEGDKQKPIESQITKQDDHGNRNTTRASRPNKNLFGARERCFLERNRAETANSQAVADPKRSSRIRDVLGSSRSVTPRWDREVPSSRSLSVLVGDIEKRISDHPWPSTVQEQGPKRSGRSVTDRTLR